MEENKPQNATNIKRNTLWPCRLHCVSMDAGVNHRLHMNLDGTYPRRRGDPAFHRGKDKPLRAASGEHRWRRAHTGFARRQWTGTAYRSRAKDTRRTSSPHRCTQGTKKQRDHYYTNEMCPYCIITFSGVCVKSINWEEAWGGRGLRVSKKQRGIQMRIQSWSDGSRTSPAWTLDQPCQTDQHELILQCKTKYKSIFYSSAK